MPRLDPPSSRAPLWEWVQAVLLAGNLGWTTLCLGGYRPETLVITSALTTALLGVHFGVRALLPGPWPGIHPASGWLLPFLVYAAANVYWVTPVRWLGWQDWFGWAQMIAVFWVVLNGIRSRRPQLLVFGVLVALGIGSVVLACFQRFVQPDWMMLGRAQTIYFMGRASGPFGIPNSLAAFLLLLLPVTGALAFQRGASAVARIGWGWIAMVLAFGLLLTISRGAWLGLALALTAWPLASRRLRWRRRLAIAAITLGVISLVSVSIYQGSPKARARLAELIPEAGERTRPIMWRAAWNLFREHPVVGSGAGSYNVLFEKYRPERFNDEVQWAHNDYLNTLSDYGGIGFLLFFGGVVTIIWRCRRGRQAGAGGHPPRDLEPPAGGEPFTERTRRGGFDGPGTRSALGIGLLAFALQLFVDFHFKLPALAMSFAVIAALAVGRWIPPPDDAKGATSPRRRRMLAGASVGIALLGGVVFSTIFRGEALRYRARQTMDQLALAPPALPAYRALLAEARESLVQATLLSPSNAQSWADQSYAATLWAHVEPGRASDLGKEAEIAADRALELSHTCPEFWIRRSIARDLQGRWLEAGNDAVRALALAPNNTWAWYHHASHLSLRPTERGLADAAVAFCLRLDPWNPAGLALRQRLAISRKAP